MQSKSEKIAKNTILLTFRMLFLMGVNLYTSRVLLQALGMDDYGIYNVVGGFVALFSIISISLSASISRFITIELGRGNKEKLKRVFSTSIIIQLCLSGIIFILLETVGLWFLNAKMNIPTERNVAANWVFQLSIITFVINLISVPYNAVIIAYEKMSAFAYISIYEGIVKLLIAFAIIRSPIDRLVYYALLMCILAISVRFIYTTYCKKRFEECAIQRLWDFSLFREMFKFAGWNFIGAASGLLRDQGGNIIINLFCGPTANAARGIAYQVNSAVQSFVTSFTTALNPQITKSYASGESNYMMNLIYTSSRISVYILFILSLPIILNTPYILNLWLNQVPNYTVIFVRLVLVLTMSETISNPLITAMLATGNIKKYQIVVGGLIMMNLPISYIFLKNGMQPAWVFIIAIIISQLSLAARLYLLRPMIGLNIRLFIKDVLFNLFVVVICASTPTYLLYRSIPLGIKNFILVSIFSVALSSIVIWTIGFNKFERVMTLNKIKSVLKR